MDKGIPVVSIIIPTYNRSKDIIKLLDSIAVSSFSDYEVIVVDNHSEEDIESLVRERAMTDERLKFVGLDFNMMAAGGRNEGIRNAKGDYFLFIDSDNVIDPDMIKNLISYMERDSHVGMIGPIMMYYRRPKMIWFAGNEINLITSRTIYWNHNEMIEHLKSSSLFETDHIPNVMMVSRKVQQEIGFFDEKYYIMYEEADFAARVRKAGYKIMVCKDAVTYHNCLLPSEIADNEMRKLGCDNPERTFHFSKNRGIFIRKYAPWYGRLAYFAVFRFLFIGYYCGAALKNHRADIARAYLRGAFYREREKR